MTPEDTPKEIPIKVGTKTRRIHVDYLARIEGEGSLLLQMKNNKVENVQLKIFEPPRFFEALLQGRDFMEAPDITSRICGICPVAYQLTAACAMEEGFNVQMPEYLQQLRRILYCGEWIESHSLHVFMLHIPDFLGYPDAVEMSKGHKELVLRGLRIKKAGNQIIKILGGREIHPINVKVGGFYKLPEKNELLSLIPTLQEAIDDTKESILFASKLSYPILSRNYEWVCLSSLQEYPMARGLIHSNLGLHLSADSFLDHFEEEHLPHSTALYAKVKSRGSYLVGPLARYNLCGSQLGYSTAAMIKEISFETQCNNPFRSVLIRLFEILYSLEEALHILKEFDAWTQPASIPLIRKACQGSAATEAPRGLLFHSYEIDEKGIIKKAKIIPPTSQNQKSIEEDLFDFAKQNSHLSDKELTWHCEMSVRNYDPCISCSAHFLRLEKMYE